MAQLYPRAPGTHFSRLLRHALVTVGLFLFPGHHSGNLIIMFTQKFSDWPPGARTANDTALCHQMQLYRYFVSQSTDFCSHNPLCCFSKSVYYYYYYYYYYYCLFRYRLSPETSGYTLVLLGTSILSPKF
jgi:hypothetical protein